MTIAGIQRVLTWVSFFIICIFGSGTVLKGSSYGGAGSLLWCVRLSVYKGNCVFRSGLGPSCSL